MRCKQVLLDLGSHFACESHLDDSIEWNVYQFSSLALVLASYLLVGGGMVQHTEQYSREIHVQMSEIVEVACPNLVDRLCKHIVRSRLFSPVVLAGF